MLVHSLSNASKMAIIKRHFPKYSSCGAHLFLRVGKQSLNSTVQSFSFPLQNTLQIATLNINHSIVYCRRKSLLTKENTELYIYILTGEMTHVKIHFIPHTPTCECITVTVKRILLIQHLEKICHTCIICVKSKYLVALYKMGSFVLMQRSQYNLHIHVYIRCLVFYLNYKQIINSVI